MPEPQITLWKMNVEESGPLKFVGVCTARGPKLNWGKFAARLLGLEGAHSCHGSSLKIFIYRLPQYLGP